MERIVRKPLTVRPSSLEATEMPRGHKDAADLGQDATPTAEIQAAATSHSHPVLRVEHLFKQFRRGGGGLVSAVEDVSFVVSAGEVVILLGPSGCGKTTLLRCIAGLERPDAGRIEIRGRATFDSKQHLNVPTDKRGLSMIFQSYALWPHMTAFDNVAYPLRARGRAKLEIEALVVEVLDMVGIRELRRQYPSQMSGGQQQRVALARALVANNDLVLFDEPLSNVDARVREQLRFELAEMQQKLGFAAVYVTHDQAEALSLADRIAVMGDGSIQQLGSPRQIYAEPASRYVANFVGTTNELPGKVIEVISDTAVRIATAIGSVDAVPGAPLVVDDEVIVTCRPEGCTLRPEGPDTWPATIETSMFMGSHTEYLARVDEIGLKIWSTDGGFFSAGEACRVTVMPGAMRALPA
jgi:iron(III) transport system ATP-binding protein